MISRIHVKNLVLIEEADLELGDGLHILTGETGAGKSILLGSIELALGGKAPKELVREGCEFGLVEIVFEVENEETLRKLAELGVEPEDGQIVISRKIKGNKSVNRINAETVTAGMLKSVGECLMDIYGQHEHQTLLSEKNHRRLLDEYGAEAIRETAEQVERLYREKQNAEKRLLSFDLDEEKRLRELDLIQYEIKELEEADLKLGEEEALEAEYRKASNAQTLLTGMERVENELGESGAAGAVQDAIGHLTDLLEYDESVRPIYDELMDLDAILSETLHAARDYARGVTVDESALMQMEDRIDTINRLKGKYGGTVEKALAFYEKQKEQLAFYQTYEEEKQAAEAALAACEQQLNKAAAELSGLRKQAAVPFEKEMKQVLEQLNFLDVDFQVSFEEKEPGADGMDVVRFLISTNPGEPVRPLAKIASGGELSRIMLGLKTIFADQGGTDTLIFDEIDTGISGRTAQKVAERLSAVSANHQVICITHLPQIAAMADVHFFIEKEVQDTRTCTQIRALSWEESSREIARMLGGVKITDAVLQNAVEMKELAKQRKAN